MIVIAEHELMKTELQFAIYQGIPVHEKNEGGHQKSHYKSNIVRPSDIKGKLKQWRILFYLDSLRDVDMIKLLKYKEDEDDSLYIQIKLFEYHTKFKLIIPKAAHKSSKLISKIKELKVQTTLLSYRTKKLSV